MKFSNSIQDFLFTQQEALSKMQGDPKIILDICDILIKARNQNKKIFTMGNGGSASTASHFVSDLLKTALTKNSKKFNAISLVDNLPVFSAWANDVSYDDVFVEQLKNYYVKGDIIIGISGSGNSKNVIKALEYGKQNSAFCIGLTGLAGGKMKKCTDLCLRVPTNDMLAIESLHVTICHSIIASIRSLGTPVFQYI